MKIKAIVALSYVLILTSCTSRRKLSSAAILDESLAGLDRATSVYVEFRDEKITSQNLDTVRRWGSLIKQCRGGWTQHESGLSKGPSDAMILFSMHAMGLPPFWVDDSVLQTVLGSSNGAVYFRLELSRAELKRFQEEFEKTEQSLGEGGTRLGPGK